MTERRKSAGVRTGMNYTQQTDRTTRLTPNDAGYVVTHANEDGAHVDTVITLTERLDLALEERGHEMVLAERARESHR